MIAEWLVIVMRSETVALELRNRIGCPFRRILLR